ncbi:TPA: 2TM domain-containing protein [Enterobacter cancerogenus]|uniref:helix-turn-helix domain-containing protein n=1 Tax=Enterobacter cancerogenus TaxID=69218 RepID=UPI001299737A|nr:helix-turn-helix domain-containing protein [Enterobacter cancerogenus]MRG34233.1 helix-turn-helix domain-containing protein [Enterobacter cancerogenus]QZY39563.1 helix-turn-helix domain-containing protein [Enterobacter cancerogenus]
MNVAEKVKALRLKKAWSQEQLAEVASLSVRTVQRTEKGLKPGLETLSALASAFEVSVSELSEEAGEAGNALDERISDARSQVVREMRFYRRLATAFLVCSALMIVNYLFTPKSYWSLIVTAIWGCLVVFRGISVFVIRDQLKSWQQHRLNKLLRPGTGKKER